MFKNVSISLANKCQLLFGAAVVLILTAALVVVSWRMQALVDRASRNNAQQTAEAWLADQIQLGGGLTPVDNAVGPLPPDAERAISLIDARRFGMVRDRDAFLAEAIDRFQANPRAKEVILKATDSAGYPYLRYARAIRQSDQPQAPPPEVKGQKSNVEGRSDVEGRQGGPDAVPPPEPAPQVVAPAPSADVSPADEPESESESETESKTDAQTEAQTEAEADAAVVAQSVETTETTEAEAKAAGVPANNPLRSVLLINLRDRDAAMQQMINRIYTAAAGIFAGLLAIAVFWFITTRIILSPVRLLRGYAEKVSRGDLNIRSDINTGDELEDLSTMFNNMLDTIKENQDRLRGVNKSLDLKLGELAQTNVALYEANKMKGEFLANVSHELRTPLNSIVGFAEVLQETLADRTGPVDEKRKRYASNIIISSRRLLELINDLLDLAKIEAGRMELRVSSVSVADLAEGLLSLMKPQAEKRGIELVAKVQPNLPLVQTDAGKLQQVLFNFLANAVKFTPNGGRVTLRATYEPAPAPAPGSAPGSGPGIAPGSIPNNAPGSVALGDPGAVTGQDAIAGGPANGASDPAAAASGGDASGGTSGGASGGGGVRLSVTDTGPGIPQEEQSRIFEKFTQLDPGMTRSHEGTGLGLTISRELAQMLQGRVELASEPGAGATFSLILPLRPETQGKPLMPETVGG